MRARWYLPCALNGAKPSSFGDCAVVNVTLSVWRPRVPTCIVTLPPS
jgi:hypothetical protein